MCLNQGFQENERLPEDMKLALENPIFLKEHYRQIYFEVLDLAITCVKKRFDQPGYRTYQVTENLLLKAARGEDFTAELESASSFYGNDFSVPTLQSSAGNTQDSI